MTETLMMVDATVMPRTGVTLVRWGSLGCLVVSDLKRTNKKSAVGEGVETDGEGDCEQSKRPNNSLENPRFEEEGFVRRMAR